MFNLSYFDFKIPGSQLPMTRAALLCTILTSKKHSDGISKLVVKADLDKMKGTLKDKTAALEQLLTDGWKQVQVSPVSNNIKALAWGKFAVRMILHLLSKEKHSREKPFESVQQMVKQFQVDLSGTQSTGGVSSPNQTAGGASNVTQDPQVHDLLTASKTELAFLEHKHLQIGYAYSCKDHGDKVFYLAKSEKDHMVFTHEPLFGPEEEVKVPFEDLKQWRPTKKAMPRLCPEEVKSLKLAHISSLTEAELKKAEVQALLISAYKDSITSAQDSLMYAMLPQVALFSSQKLKKNDLVLYPLGSVQPLKMKEGKKSKAIILEYQNEKFQLQPWKGLTYFTQDAEGMLVAYNYVGIASDSDSVNMVQKVTTYKGLKIPVLTNSVAVAKETILLKADDEDGKEQAASSKRRKAG